MRGRRLALGLAGAMIFVPFLLFAQQQGPVNGCGAAPSCRSNGFWVLNGNAGGNVLLSVGASWDPGFHLGIAAPAAEPAQTSATQMFHLQGASLSPPPPLPTPLPLTPLPISEPPKEPPQDKD